MRTHNFFFVPRLWREKRHLSLFLYCISGVCKVIITHKRKFFCGCVRVCVWYQFTILKTSNIWKTIFFLWSRCSYTFIIMERDFEKSICLGGGISFSLLSFPISVSNGVTLVALYRDLLRRFRKTFFRVFDIHFCGGSVRWHCRLPSRGSYEA